MKKSIKSIMFPHLNFHKYTWTSNRKIQNHKDNILIDKIWHSNVAHILSFKETMTPLSWVMKSEIDCQKKKTQHKSLILRDIISKS